MVPMNVSIPCSLQERAERLAKVLGTSRALVVRGALNRPTGPLVVPDLSGFKSQFLLNLVGHGADRADVALMAHQAAHPGVSKRFLVVSLLGQFLDTAERGFCVRTAYPKWVVGTPYKDISYLIAASDREGGVREAEGGIPALMGVFGGARLLVCGPAGEILEERWFGNCMTFKYEEVAR